MHRAPSPLEKPVSRPNISARRRKQEIKCQVFYAAFVLFFSFDSCKSCRRGSFHYFVSIFVIELFNGGKAAIISP